jgi:uncharacterized membrane protein
MKTQIDAQIERLRIAEGSAFEANEAAILSEYEAETSSDKGSFAVKLLSIMGGFLASMAFVGFLGVSGLHESHFGLVLTGVLFLIAALALHQVFDTLLIDTACVSFFIIGLMMFGFGLNGFRVGDSAMAILFIVVGLITYWWSEHSILTFLSVIVICKSIFVLFYINSIEFYLPIYLCVVSLSLCFLMLSEAKCIAISAKMAERYAPTRSALMFILLNELVLLEYSDYILHSGSGTNLMSLAWLVSLVNAVGVFFLISRILILLNRNTRSAQIIVCGITALFLAITVFSPMISSSLLVLLLCFYTNYKTGGAFAILAFIYGLSQYYYDLDFTLLAKSGILFGSGMLFLLFYFFTQKTFSNDETL